MPLVVYWNLRARLKGLGSRLRSRLWGHWGLLSMWWWCRLLVMSKVGMRGLGKARAAGIFGKSAGGAVVAIWLARRFVGRSLWVWWVLRRG